MSKNFDLMQERHSDLRVPMVPQRDATVTQLHLHEGTPFRPAASLNLPRQVQEETAKLVQQVFLLQSGEGPRRVVFAGIDHDDGCAQVVAQAAQTLARSVAGTVCLVEANLRSASALGSNGIQNHRGLTDALMEGGSIREFTQWLAPEGLWFLSTGLPASDVPRLLSSEQFKARLDELSQEFDYVLVDAPPLNHYTDAVQLARMSDGVVLVLDANATRREAALKVTESLRTAQIGILGAVLNNRTFPIPELLYRRL